MKIVGVNFEKLNNICLGVQDQISQNIKTLKRQVQALLRDNDQIRNAYKEIRIMSQPTYVHHVSLDMWREREQCLNNQQRKVINKVSCWESQQFFGKEIFDSKCPSLERD